MTSLIVSFPWYRSKHLNQYHFPECILTGKILAGKMDLSLQPCKASMSRAVLCPFLGDADFWEGSLSTHDYCEALVYYLACSRIPNRSVHPVDCQVKDLQISKNLQLKGWHQRASSCWAHWMVISHSSHREERCQLKEGRTPGGENQTSDNIKGEEQTNQM